MSRTKVQRLEEKMEIISWITANWTQMLQAYLALVGAASLIIKLTPTVRDDNWLKKYLKFTGKFLALNRK